MTEAHARPTPQAESDPQAAAAAARARAGGPPPTRARRPYQPPTIDDLGTLAEVTRGSTGPAQDALGVGGPPTS